MLSVGLARAAVEAGYRTYLTTAADLAARCHRAAIEGRWATTMRFFAGPTLLVIYELGYLPLPAEAANTLFQVIPQRYLKTSIILTTNRGVGSWGEILGDTTVAAAMLDRLLLRSVVINLDGESYRLREHHARTEQLRQATTGTRTPLQSPPLQVRKFNEHPWGLSTSVITSLPSKVRCSLVSASDNSFAAVAVKSRWTRSYTDRVGPPSCSYPAWASYRTD